MKQTLLSLLLFISTNANASPKVEYTANRVHALFTFLEAISGASNRPPQLRKVFEESKFNTAESQCQIEKFKDLDPAFTKYFEYDGVPKERKSAVSVRELITIQTAFSKDLSDFRNRILGLMTLPRVNQLLDTLIYFEPIYNTLIWNPNESEVKKALSNFQRKSKSWRLNEMFESALTFYKGNWPPRQPFRISFYPIPKGAQLSTGQSYGAFQSVGLIVDEDLEGKFGVVFHELCHAIYDSQNQEMQKYLSEWFRKSESAFGLIAYQWINEALATALGNGWAYERAKGQIDKKT